MTLDATNVKVFALGGLSENGKNLYVVEVNDSIFVLDAGLQYPSEELLGVDAVIPDFSYLKENVKRIKGLFLSHGHEDHIGAVPNILESINIPVYGTRLTIALVEDILKENKMQPNRYNLKMIRPNNVLKFDDTKISFFSTTHSIPDSVGICIHTNDGVIVYTSDFTFNQNVNERYKTNFNALTDISRKGVLCLMTECLGADRQGYTDNDDMFSHKLREAFYSAEGRIIVSVFSSDLHRIQKIVDTAATFNRKIAIIGRKMQKVVDISVKLGYLRIPKEMFVNLRFIDETNDNNFPNLVVLATGSRNEPFDALIRMTRKVDRLIHVNPSDTIILATPTIPGTEIKAARTKDILFRSNTNVITISNKLLPTSQASADDLRLMVNLMKPKYIIPVIGEYRHQYAFTRIAESMGYNTENIVLLDNGDVAHFSQGELYGYTDSIDVDQILLDGSSVGDVSNVVLHDRALLSQDGILLVIGNVDMKTKKVVAGPEVITRGFIYVKNNDDIIEGVSKIYNDEVDKMFTNKATDLNKARNDIRDKVGKYLYKETKRKPIVISIMIEV